MAKGRHQKKSDTGRDSGGFIALPWSVVDCPAYSRLSMHARALLLEVARQYVRDNNGRLLLSRAYLAGRGWKSADMITKCKAELLAAGFIHETVKGKCPNKASWYAITWMALDKIPGYDVGAAETFRRSAYATDVQPTISARPTREDLYARHAGKVLLKNTPLIPPHGTESAAIGPPHGTEQSPPVPPHGPMRAVFGGLSVPPHGHHLDMPSPARLQRSLLPPCRLPVRHSITLF